MFPLIIAVELPGKRGANQDARDDAKSNSTDQTPSHRAPIISTAVNFMNGMDGIGVNRQFCCFDARMQFFVIM
jgi:hypothetical protein